MNAKGTLLEAREALEKSLEDYKETVEARSVTMRDDLGILLTYAYTSTDTLEARSNRHNRHLFRIYGKNGQQDFSSAESIPSNLRKIRAIAQKIERANVPSLFEALENFEEAHSTFTKTIGA